MNAAVPWPSILQNRLAGHRLENAYSFPAAITTSNVSCIGRIQLEQGSVGGKGRGWGTGPRKGLFCMDSNANQKCVQPLNCSQWGDVLTVSMSKAK